MAAAAAAAVAALTAVAPATTAAQQDQFSDVTRGVYKTAIDALTDRGLFEDTLCGEDMFCPDEAIDRKTMAVWVVRALDGEDPAAVSGPRFSDVDAGSFYAPFVERMAELGVTAGCADSRFCPDDTVTRAQMAVFLSSAYDLPEGPDPGFSDVPADAWYAAHVARLAASGITAGCATSPARFCPRQDTSRAQMATFLFKALSDLDKPQTPDLTGVTPTLAVHIGNPSPTIGDDVAVVATVTDAGGAPLVGAKLEFIIDGVNRGAAFTGPDGQATFTYDAPIGPSNEGGYDSLQVQVATTDVASRPVGVFWQPPESRRITISVSPDRAHTSATRTITAQVFDGTSPLAGRAVELHIDGTVAERATTNGEGMARFTRSAPVHGPFDLAKVALADDRDLASDTVLFSWPMSTRGVDSDNSWQLVWSDEFNGTSLDTAKWKANINCPPVYLACDTDRPENVYVSDGMLHLRTLRERYAGANNWRGSGEQFGPLSTFTPGSFLLKDFTAGRVESTTGFTYGRFEMLGRLPQGHGTFFAYWMRSLNSPYGKGVAAGEIDIAEGANIGKGGIDAQLPGPGWGVHHVVHMGLPFTNPFTLTNLPVNPAESFHLYTVEWDAASIRFYVDDQRVLTVPSSDWFSQPAGSEQPVDNPLAPFDAPFVVGINNTVGNWALETWPGNQVPESTVFPTEFIVDYMRVYECRPPSPSTLGPGQGCETP